MEITIIRPGGNDTALVKGIPPKSKRKEINDKIMKLYPTVEQVGFYAYATKNNPARLEMAGGEFCGNATRSLAYLLLNGKKGNLNIRVSGTKQILVCGTKLKGTAYAQMPIYADLNSVEKLSPTLSKITIEGITHLITQKPQKKSAKELKKIAYTLLKKNNLLASVPASGVMFISQKNNQLISDPIVWVRDIKTLFYETACASGTTAIGLWQSYQKTVNKITLDIQQPSKQIISVIIQKNKNSFKNAYITGSIELLKKEELL